MQRLSLLSLAAAAALVALSPALAFETRLIDVSNDRFVEVTGEGSVSAAPDFARLTLGVTTADKDARRAMAENAQTANAVVALIKAEGVAPADIQTSGLSISPVYAQPTPAQAGAPSIAGYSVSNNVTVTARDISRLGTLLDKAVGAGANTVYGIAFGQNDPSALLDKARPLAVADAKRKADIYANAAGARVGRLMQLTEEGGPQPVALAARAYAKNAPTPVEAGEDRLGVVVTARFELTP